MSTPKARRKELKEMATKARKEPQHNLDKIKHHAAYATKKAKEVVGATKQINKKRSEKIVKNAKKYGLK